MLRGRKWIGLAGGMKRERSLILFPPLPDLRESSTSRQDVSAYLPYLIARVTKNEEENMNSDTVVPALARISHK